MLKSYFEQFEIGDYGSTYHPAEVYAWWRLKQKLRSLLPQPTRQFSLLDVGCNIGRDIFALPATYRMTHRVGIDVAANLVSWGAHLAAARGEDGVDFCCADGQVLPFRQETFDVIWCSEVIEHFSTPYDALREFYRCLKPNGVLLLSTPNPEATTELIAQFMPSRVKQALAHGRYEDMARSGPRNVATPETYDSVEHRSIMSLAKWKMLLEACSFSVALAAGACIAGGARVISQNRLLLITMLITDLISDLPFFQRFRTPLILKAAKK